MKKLVKYSTNEAGLIGPPIIAPKKRKRYRRRGQPRRKLWKNKELIQLLKIKAMALGRAPSEREVNEDPDMPRAEVFIHHFDTWNLALTAAGLPPRKSSTSITPKEKEARWKVKREELIELYLKKWEELGHLPLCSEISADPKMPSCGAYYKYFGSFQKLLKELEESPYRNHKWRNSMDEYNDEFLCMRLRTKWYQMGRTPTWRDIAADPMMPSTSTYTRRWGTWTKALEAAKVPVNQRNANIARQYSDEQLLQIIRDIYETLGRAPVVQDLRFSPYLPTVNTYKRLGGLANARRLAGIPDPDAPTKTKVRVRKTSPRWSRERIAEAFYAKYRLLGRMPSWSEVNKDENMPCMTTVRRHFKTANAALEYYYEMRPYMRTYEAGTNFFA